MLNTLQQHLRNVRSVISRSYNVHQCHPKVLMVFFLGGADVQREADSSHDHIFTQVKFCFSWLDFVVNLKSNRTASSMRRCR